LHPDGALDTSFRASPELGCADVRRANALVVEPDGSILVGASKNQGEETPTALFRLSPEGCAEPAFAVPLEDDDYPQVANLVLQPDGRVLASGYFDKVNGVTIPNFARLNTDGTLDRSFHPDPNLHVMMPRIALQPDGRIVLAGTVEYETSEGGSNVSHRGVARLLPDGRLDTTFNPGSGIDPYSGYAAAVALQPDGKILLGGTITHYNGTDAGPVIRLESDGRLDSGFHPPAMVADNSSGRSIHCLAAQADGRILVGGTFARSDAGRAVPWCLARLNPDGSEDPTFPRAFTLGWTVLVLAIQPDGRILVGGDGSQRTALVRLNPDGSVDTSFGSQTISQFSYVYSLALQADGKILAGLTQDPGLLRLNPDGTIDPTLRVTLGGLGRWVNAVQVQPDGRVLFGGWFQSVNGVTAYNLARIYGDPIQPWPHPADTTAPPWTMGISEVTGYGAAWRRGQPWPVPPNPIPIDYVTRAGYLWRQGECYAFTSNVFTAPLWWVPCNPSSGVARSLDADGSPLRIDASAAISQQPVAFVPGERLTITISTMPAEATTTYAVADRFPMGWFVANLSPGGQVDTTTGQVKWGPFFDGTPRTLSYQVTPPVTANGQTSFQGVASFDGASVPVSGARQLRASCRVHRLRPVGSGQFRLSFAGNATARWNIEASSDLTQWTTLTTVTQGTDWIEFSDPDGRRYPQRFYRAKLVE